jgi:hypothetical protein
MALHSVEVVYQIVHVHSGQALEGVSLWMHCHGQIQHTMQFC